MTKFGQNVWIKIVIKCIKAGRYSESYFGKAGGVRISPPPPPACIELTFLGVLKPVSDNLNHSYFVRESLKWYTVGSDT